MSKNFMELRFRNGQISGRLRLHRMLGEEEVPTVLGAMQRGIELGQSAMAEAWTAQGPKADVDEELHRTTAAQYGTPAGDLWEARAEAEYLTHFWYDVLNGIGSLTFKAPMALHYALMHQAILDVSVQRQTANIGVRGADGTPDKERYVLSVERANVQEIRAFVLWLIRSAGIPVAAPPGWPDPPTSEEPPNGAGERYVPGAGVADAAEADVEGPDADGFEEV